MPATIYEDAAAALLRESGCTVRKWRKNNTGTAYTKARDWGIECPRPTTARRFGVLAHEVGHQLMHRQGQKPRWVEEVEAEVFALEQFLRFGLPGIETYQHVAVRHLRYTFAKATRRSPRLHAVIYARFPHLYLATKETPA